MTKGVDYIGIAVVFFCHDGQGNFVMHRRGQACRDERGRWDFGGGGLKFGETLEAALYREINEEYGTKPLVVEYLGIDECFRTEDDVNTHWVVFRYKVQVNRDEVINNEPDKHEELGWFTLDTLPAPLHSNLPRELEKFGHQLRQ
jgi:8-oxo-dGTP diphosphatase